MLAPLEDRRVLADSSVACESGEAGANGEMRALQRALRASRLRLRRSALQSTRQIMALNAEVSRLQSLCDRQTQQIARYAAGTVIVDLGRKLMALSEANARLLDDSRRAVMLERVLGIADAERRRLSLECDALARALARSRYEHPVATPLQGACHVPTSL